MSFETFVPDILATVIGGAIITFLLFVAKERLFPIARMSGVWTLTTTTLSTIRPEYAEMVLTYRVMIWQSGNYIAGTAEKIAEKVKGGSEKKYKGPDRTRSIIEGNVEKNYLSKDVISIHMLEKGEARESTTYFRLNCDSPIECTGEWASTAADSSGSAIWKKVE